MVFWFLGRNFNDDNHGYKDTTYLVFFFFFLLSLTTRQDIDYEGFRCFLDAFLDCETPTDLAQHLFMSFLRTNGQMAISQGKVLNQMAAISSNTACAPVTSHTINKGRIIYLPKKNKKNF